MSEKQTINGKHIPLETYGTLSGADESTKIIQADELVR